MQLQNRPIIKSFASKCFIFFGRFVSVLEPLKKS